LLLALLSLLLLSVELLDTAETVEEEIVVLAVSVSSDLVAVSVVAFLVLFVSFFILMPSLLRDSDFADEFLVAFSDLSTVSM